MTSTLEKQMIAIFESDPLYGDTLVCVTEENSATHQEYIAANHDFMQKEIETWLTPFEERELLYFNLGAEIAKESNYDLTTYIKYVAGPGHYRSEYLAGGIEELRASMKYQCLMDYYRATIGYNLFTKSGLPRGHESYANFVKQLSHEEIFRAVYCNTNKYRFAAVTAA